MGDQIVSGDDSRVNGEDIREIDDAAMVKANIRASRPPWLIALPLAVLLLAGTAVYLAMRDDSPTPAADGSPIGLESESVALEPDEALVDDEAAVAGVEVEGDAQDTPAAPAVETDIGVASLLPEPPSDAPYIDATLTENIFVLSGIVPDEETKLALEASAELAYAPFHTSKLSVDPTVGSADWLAVAPTVIGLIPMITDGTIRLQDDSATLIGRSPKQVWADDFAGAVGSLTGLPVRHDAVEVTGLGSPRFVVGVADGKVLLEGEIPSQQLIDSFVGGATAVYGPENVTSTMTVDDSTYTSFWNYTIPGVLQLLQPFPSYKVQVVDGIFSGNMQGAVLFETNSAGISTQADQLLPIGLALMARDINLPMTIIGHTDSRGPDELNQTLSLQRAESVVASLIASGVDASRLTADGKGSTEPIASNETEDGRALNRRVEFVFGQETGSTG